MAEFEKLLSDYEAKKRLTDCGEPSESDYVRRDSAREALLAHVAALEAELARVQPQAVQASAAIASLAEELAKAREALTAMADRICNTFCRPINRHRFSQKPEDMKHCKLCSEMDERLKSALTPGGHDDTR